jgi:methyl-accepting chemotaxis protein
MKNLGIKSRVIFLGTIPALLFAIILVGYAITNIFDVLDQSLEDRGKVIASQLAPAAEYGVISGNSQVLQRLVQQALSNEQDLRTVMVVDSQGLTLALSGRELSKALLAKILKENLEQIPQDKGIIFTFPIYRSLVEIDDFSNLSSKELELKKSYTPEKIGQVYVELSNQTLQNIKQDLIVKIFLTAIFGLALSGLLAWKLGRHITKPIQEIAQAVNRIGEGVFSHTIMEDSSGELKTLQKGFNSMSSSLKHAYDSMQDKINDATSMLRHQAQHDDLTGLINRREFEVRLERCLKSVYEHNAQHIFVFWI